MNVFGAFPEWFGGLYALAFLSGYVVAAVIGYRRGWPLAAWLLVLAAAGIGGVVGTRLLPLGLEGLQALLATGVLPETATKRIPGTVAGALALAVGARWLLGLRRSVLDPLAYAGLASLAVARVGCLLAGCCFGTPTDLPWGVTYAEGSFTHGFHVAHGVIEAGAAPHPVHPIPLYDIAFALVGLALLPRLARRLRAPGSLCWATVGGYAAYRFVQDFVRANELASVGGLTRVQWVCLAAAALALAGVALRERRARRQLEGSDPAPALARLALVFVALLAMRALLDGWLTPLEEGILLVRLLPAAVALAILAWRQHAAAQIRWATAAAAFGLPALLGFQLAPTDSTARSSFFAVDAHGGMGKYEDVDVCSSALYEYRTGGAAVVHVTADPARSFSRELGVRVYGSAQERVDPEGADGRPVPAQRTRAVSPYVQIEGRYIGGHFGFHIGEIPVLGGHENDANAILPSLGARLGPREAHVHIGVLDGAQFGSPAPGARIGVGTGWLTPRGQEARVQFGGSPNGAYALVTLPLEQLTLEPMVAYGGREGFYHTGLRVRAQLGGPRPRDEIPALPDSASSTPPTLSATPDARPHVLRDRR